MGLGYSTEYSFDIGKRKWEKRVYNAPAGMRNRTLVYRTFVDYTPSGHYHQFDKNNGK